MAGKFLNSWPLATKPPYFDRVSMVKGGYTDQYWNLDGTVRLLPDYTTTLIGSKAVEYIDTFDQTNDAKPWFIMLTPLAPHGPRTPEPKYATAPVPPWSGNPAVNENVGDKPSYIRWRPTLSQTEIDSLRTGQLRTLMSVDDMVDRVMRELEAKGELDNTMVIFTSDNGYHWGEHRYFGKFTPYTPSVQVPLFLRWPGRVAPGSTSRSLVTNLDIAPTILGAAGVVASDPPLDGRSLLSSVQRDRLLLEYTYDVAQRRPSRLPPGRRRSPVPTSTSRTSRATGERSSGSTTTWSPTPGSSPTCTATARPPTIRRSLRWRPSWPPIERAAGAPVPDGLWVSQRPDRRRDPDRSMGRVIP